MSPGTLTNGVSIVLSATHGFGALTPTIRVPFVDKYACSGADPPVSEAGFVHDPVIAGSSLCPNNVLPGGGTVDRNDEKFTTQPICPGLRHNGIDVNWPPTSLPAGVNSVAPSRYAPTSCFWI